MQNLSFKGLNATANHCTIADRSFPSSRYLLKLKSVVIKNKTIKINRDTSTIFIIILLFFNKNNLKNKKALQQKAKGLKLSGSPITL